MLFLSASLWVESVPQSVAILLLLTPLGVFMFGALFGGMFYFLFVVCKNISPNIKPMGSDRTWREIYALEDEPKRKKAQK